MTTLDHTGILVPKLDTAAALLGRLGFTLTRRAEHRAADGSSAGSAQCSLMLEEGYVEIQELADLDGSHIMAASARRNFGLHILAYGEDDAEAARARVLSAGLPVGPVLRWARQVHEPDIEAEARFAFFVAPYDVADDAFLCWVQHLTPEALRSPRLLRHANGARALRSAIIATSGNPARLLARHAAAGGRPEIHARESLPPVIAGAAWPAPDWFAALRIAFADPSAFADLATAEGFSVQPWADALLVDLRAPLGCFIVAQSA